MRMKRNGIVGALVMVMMLLTSLARADARLSGELAKAIRTGDLDAAKAAVEAGADLNAPDERKMPPIGAAALLGKVDIVNYLAEKGADVNRNDGYGFTPLMCAAQRGQAGAVKALLRHGADPTLKGGNGSDALFYAQPKGPADPQYDEKMAVVKILKDAIAARGNANPAQPPAVAQPAAPAQPAVPKGNAVPPAVAFAPGTNIPDLPIEQSAVVVKDSDGALGVGEKDGKPLDGVKVSVNDSEEASPSIAVAPDGSIHIAFNETHGPPYQTAVYHRSSTDGGKTWGEAKNLSEDQIDLHVGRCVVIADAQNRVYIVWRTGLGKNFQAPTDPFTGGHCNLVYRVLAGGKWSKVLPIHSPGSEKTQDNGALDFYVALDHAGRVQVVWNTNPGAFHDELVDLVKMGDGSIWRRGFNNVGPGLVYQATLDGTNSTPPHESMITPITGRKGDVQHPPACYGLHTLNGFVDAAGQPVFIAALSSYVDEAIRNKHRYQIFEHGQPGPFLDLPDLSFHAWRDIPTLLVDAQGKRHVIVFYTAGERPSIRDYTIGSDEDPVIIRKAIGPKATANGMQAYQGPGGRMIVLMQMNDTGENGEGDLFISTSTGGGKWSPPVNVTNNPLRRSFAARVINPVQNVAVSKSFYPGPAAATFDKDGHLLVLMIQNERGLFGDQVGVRYYGGSSTTPATWPETYCALPPLSPARRLTMYATASASISMARCSRSPRAGHQPSASPPRCPR